MPVGMAQVNPYMDMFLRVYGQAKAENRTCKDANTNSFRFTLPSCGWRRGP